MNMILLKFFFSLHITLNLLENIGNPTYIPKFNYYFLFNIYFSFE